MIDDLGAALLLGGEPFTVAMANDHGLTARRVWQLSRNGVLQMPVQGVFLDASVPLTVRRTVRAVSLVLPPGAVIGGVSAAAVLGIDARSPAQAAAPHRVETIVPIGSQPLRRPGVVGRVADLQDHDVMEVDGIWITTPVRTVVDLLRQQNQGAALAAADMFARAEIVRQAAVVEEVERWGGHPNVTIARRLATLIDPRSESGGESALRLRLVDAELPPAELQHEVRAGRVVRRLDLAWPERRKAMEYDGEADHTDPADVAHDGERRLWLERVGGFETAVARKEHVWGWALSVEDMAAALLGVPHAGKKRTW